MILLVNPVHQLMTIQMLAKTSKNIRQRITAEQGHFLDDLLQMALKMFTKPQAID